MNCNWRKRIHEDECRRGAAPITIIPEDYPDAIVVRAAIGKHPNHWSTDPVKTTAIGVKIAAWYTDPSKQEQVLEHNRKISVSRKAVGNEKLRQQADERNAERNDRILELRAQDLTYDQIAALVGCSKATVAKIVKRLS